jgi:hypothetical protein
MRFRSLFVPLALCHVLSLAGFAEDRAHVTARSDESLAGGIENIPFIVLRGTIEQRGQAMGRLWGDYFLRSLADIVPVARKQDPQGWEKLAQTADRTFTTPDEIARQMQAFITGFRQSVPLDRRTALLGRDLEVKDVKAIYVFADLVSAGRISPNACSSFSAWGALTEGGDVIVGRNLDYDTFPGLLPFAIVAQAPSEKDRLATVDITTLWFGALTIMNEKGVLALGHDELSLASNYETGLTPRFLALRPAIESAQPASAPQDLAAALRDTRPVTGTSFHIAMPLAANGAPPTVLEWDGNSKDHGVTLRIPDAKDNLPALFCTNHYLARANQRLANSSSARRYDIMVQMVRDALAQNRKIDVKTAEQIMNAASVRGAVSTQMSLIALPAARQFHIALSAKPGASAADGPWIQVDWNDLFSAK